MAATSHDVARLAGVSQPTVSRALRGEPGVALETRQRVEDAARTLGYVASQLGRSLATLRTRRIGIVAAELTNPFYPHLVEPLHDHFERAGYRSVLYAEREDSRVAFAELVDGSLDGIVLTTTLMGSPLPKALLQRGMPFVFLNRENEERAADAVVMDNDYGAVLVADLIAGLGHRHVGAVLGPLSTSTGSQRETGFRRGLAGHGLELLEKATARGPFAFAAGRAGLRSLLALTPAPTALFCANDVLALGALDEATRLGVRVPEDLTIVGFDDISMSSMARFNLTTVHCDLARLVADAADLLLKRIADPGRPHNRIVQQPELILRGSHAPPAAGPGPGHS
jgi:LacI family transcriptional regulator